MKTKKILESGRNWLHKRFPSLDDEARAKFLSQLAQKLLLFVLVVFTVIFRSWRVSLAVIWTIVFCILFSKDLKMFSGGYFRCLSCRHLKRRCERAAGDFGRFSSGKPRQVCTLCAPRVTAILNDIDTFQNSMEAVVTNATKLTLPPAEYVRGQGSPRVVPPVVTKSSVPPKKFGRHSLL